MHDNAPKCIGMQYGRNYTDLRKKLHGTQLIVHPKKHDLMERGAHTQVLRWHQEPVRPIDGARGAQEPVLEH